MIESFEASWQTVGDTGLRASAEPAFDRIAGLARVLLSVPVAVVALFDAQGQFFPGAAGLAEPWATLRQAPLSHTLYEPADLRQGPVVVADARTDPRCAHRPAISSLRAGSYVAMPLTDNAGTVLGALCVIGDRPRAWSATDLSQLSDLALTCSDSLQSRIALGRAESRSAAATATSRQARAVSARGELLLKASVLLAQARTVADTVDAVAQLTSPVFDPDLIGMVLLDDEHRLRVFGADGLPGDVASRWVSFPTSAPLPAATAFRTGQLLSLPDPAAITAEFPQLADEFFGLGWKAIACQPLPGVHGTLGVLTLSWTHPQHLDAEQRSIIVTVAGYLGQALQRIAHLDAQYTAARTLQRALLTRLPHTATLRLAARYLPAHHGDLVGGDWYDTVPLADDRLALVIGDVSGHNLTAAAAMSELRSMARALLIDRPDTPSGVLHRLDHANQALGADIIATAVIAYLDPQPDGSHRLQWSNAGHPAPTLITAGNRVTGLPGADPLLGARHRRPRSTHHHVLPPGATLLLHTDGLIETRDASLDEGISQLHRLLSHHRDPVTFADVLAAHANARIREDDVAFLLATAVPVAARHTLTAPAEGDCADGS
ncbi:Protein icfG [Actinoplanes sp. SE50]|uniref:SpoIIE family protein phosphatase n=1 Tax=unclassified Actinoplanes TaxID=2626549 RepID=UPI00023ECB13|nr:MULTISPECIES: SpoIIE family protein phosphatase [unclassified Actinoplanes]AEV84275.1 Protein icfG [Actinoplanes sp. SE50/110]ATO82667.1 Protein icfG [Actinoplanes sp. SE50]SLM00074.1 Protein icfG [Actinoplanes sp. SE50/110]